MDNDIKSQILELYGSVQEYSDSGSFNLTFSIANQKAVVSGKFATKYTRANNKLNMSWSRRTELEFENQGKQEVLKIDKYKLQVGDCANLLHVYAPVKRLVAVGKNNELELKADLNSFFLTRIIPPLLKEDLFTTTKNRFDAQKAHFEVEESEHFNKLKLKNSVANITVFAGKDHLIKEVIIERVDLKDLFKDDIPKFGEDIFESLKGFVQKNLPTTFAGTYKFEKVSMNNEPAAE